MEAITYVKSINRALDELLAKEPKVYLFGEDIRDPYGGTFKATKGLSTKYPARVFDTPISESGLVGLVTGMAMRGLRPILEIMFGDFLALCMDQILNSSTKFAWMYNHQVKAPFVIRTPMGGRRGYGPTHSQSIEKLFFGIQGIKVLAPSCAHSVGDLLKRAVLNEEMPVLFVENKYSYPLKLSRRFEGFIFASDNNPYETLILENENAEKADVTLLTYGGMFNYTLLAAQEMFLQEEIKSEIIVPSLIQPLTKSCLSIIENSIAKTGRCIVIEEGTLTNGWGAETSSLIHERCFEKLRAPIKRVASLNLPIPCTKILEEYILADEKDIKKAVEELML